MKYLFPELKSRITMFLAFFLVAAISACAGESGDTDRIEPISWEARDLEVGTWVVMGSSTAAGAGATPGKSWAELLPGELAHHPRSLVNIAKGGTVTYQGLSAAAAPVPGRPLPDTEVNIDRALSLDPVLLFVSYPSNDTAVGYPVEETVSNILSIRSLALARSVPVIVVSTQPRNLSDEKLAQLALIDERVAAETGPCFVSVRFALAAANGQLAAQYDAGDGVHPNNPGHLLIATQIRSVLESGRCVVLPGE